MNLAQFRADLRAWLDERDLLTPEAVAALDDTQLDAMLRFAARAASITCSRRGADMPRRAEL